MTRLLVLALSLALAGAAQARGDAAAGKEKAAQTCDYLVRALRDYKSGKRSNAVMKGFTASLSRQDIEDLAAWFASQESGLHYQR